MDHLKTPIEISKVQAAGVAELLGSRPSPHGPLATVSTRGEGSAICRRRGVKSPSKALDVV